MIGSGSASLTLTWTSNDSCSIDAAQRDQLGKDGLLTLDQEGVDLAGHTSAAWVSRSCFVQSQQFDGRASAICH